jgi:hypothetical protein
MQKSEILVIRNHRAVPKQAAYHLTYACMQPKGNGVKIPQPGQGDWRPLGAKRGNANETPNR